MQVLSATISNLRYFANVFIQDLVLDDSNKICIISSNEMSEISVVNFIRFQPTKTSKRWELVCK